MEPRRPVASRRAAVEAGPRTTGVERPQRLATLSGAELPARDVHVEFELSHGRVRRARIRRSTRLASQKRCGRRHSEKSAT